jgi:HK97 family phage major capsid protein
VPRLWLAAVGTLVRAVRTGDEANELRALAKGSLAEVEFDLGTTTFRNAHSESEFRIATTGTAANAGNTKATAVFVNEILTAMRERSSFLSLVRTINTESGETLEWPVKNALDPTIAPVQGTVGIVAENTQFPKVDQQWSKANLGSYKIGIMSEVTAEILEDTRVPLLSILTSDMGETLADRLMAYLMNGTGTAQPKGWITAATAGTNAASVSAITFDDMLNLQYSIRAPYRQNGVYMLNDALIPTLRKLKSTDGHYLWQPSVLAGQPDTIWGKPVYTDINVAASGAGAKVALFGDPGKYLLRQIRSLKLTRSDEYGFDRDVVAYKCTWRGDGTIFDLNSVKALTITA